MMRRPEVLEPEVLSPHEPHPDPVVDWIVHYMERVFNVGGYRFGLDGIIGLLPGAGDAIGGLISAIIIYRAAQAGVPRSALLRMSANVAIDTALGAIPFIGDLFDFAFKANSINARIYKEALRGRHRASSDWLFLGGLALLLGLLIAIPILILYWIGSALFTR